MPKKTLGTGSGGKSFGGPVEVGLLVSRNTLGLGVLGGLVVILVLRCTLGAAVDAIIGVQLDEEELLAIVVLRKTSGFGVKVGLFTMLDDVEVSIRI